MYSSNVIHSIVCSVIYIGICLNIDGIPGNSSRYEKILGIYFVCGKKYTFPLPPLFRFLYLIFFVLFNLFYYYLCN